MRKLDDAGVTCPQDPARRGDGNGSRMKDGAEEKKRSGFF